MLNLFRKACWALFWVLCVAFVIWLIGGSPSFQDCINQPQNKNAAQGLEEIVANLFIYRGCIGPFIHANESDITAVSTLFIAVFTAVLGIFTVRLARSTRIAANEAKVAA